MIGVDENVCRNLESALRREWLETSGIGGFASSTINGCNTREYHGLLIAATRPPVGRFVLLSRFEETLMVNGRTYELGTNRYAAVVRPQGFQFLTQFRLDPFPMSTFGVDGVEIEKSCSWYKARTRQLSNINCSMRQSMPACGSSFVH